MIHGKDYVLGIEDEEPKTPKWAEEAIPPVPGVKSGMGSGQATYLVSERKLGLFVQSKIGEHFNRRNTLSILRIKI